MANIRLKKNQVDPKNPHATSVTGPAIFKGNNINSVQIESSRKNTTDELVVIEAVVPENRYKLGKSFKTDKGQKMVVSELFSNGMGLAETVDGKFGGLFFLNSLNPFGDKWRSQSALAELELSDISWNYRCFRDDVVAEALEENPAADVKELIRKEMQSAIEYIEDEINKEQQALKWIYERPDVYDRQHKVNLYRDFRYLQAGYAAAYGESEMYHYKMTKLAIVNTLDEGYQDYKERSSFEFETLMKEAVDNLSNDDLTYEELAEFRIKANLCKYGLSHRSRHCSSRCEYDYNKMAERQLPIYNLPEPIYQNPIRFSR